MWILWAIYAVIVIALVVVGFLMTPKPATQPKQTANELQVPVAEVGKKIPILFGRRRITDPNITWYGDIEVEEVLGNPASKK